MCGLLPLSCLWIVVYTAHWRTMVSRGFWSHWHRVWSCLEMSTSARGVRLTVFITTSFCSLDTQHDTVTAGSKRVQLPLHALIQSPTFWTVQENRAFWRCILMYNHSLNLNNNNIPNLPLSVLLSDEKK